MMKRIIFYVIFFCIALPVIAGDVAAFVDEGFSQDGNLYVFGQYGSLDKVWQGFAEIYTVDIAKNDYTDSGCFETAASSATAGKSGHSVYEDLRKKNAQYIDSLALTSVNIDNILYIKSNTKNPLDTITFQDFEGSAESNPVVYKISLVPWFSGTTATSVSSFFISVEKFDIDGNMIGTQVIGNPDIKRKGVVGYSIEKIMRSPDGKNLIFIVEKILQTENGESIRYMVETLVDSRFRT
ncbi:MAG: DUF2259 domain-containing protein [Spirochaetales bacterium]